MKAAVLVLCLALSLASAFRSSQSLARSHPFLSPRTAERSKAQRLVVTTPGFSSQTLPQSSLSMISPTTPLSTSSTYLVRIVFLRALAFVSGVAFLVGLKQNKALIGDNGITPARYVLNEAQERGRIKRERRLAWRNETSTYSKRETTQQSGVWGILSNTKIAYRIGAMIDRNTRFLRLRELLWDRSDGMDRPVTSLLWLAKDREKLNPWLDNIAIAGLLMSLTVFVKGAANVPVIFGMWICQRSLMAVGG